MLIGIAWKYYFLFLGLLVFFFVFAYFYFLETKGLTMEEVGRVFDGKDSVEQVQAHAYDRQMAEKVEGQQEHKEVRA